MSACSTATSAHHVHGHDHARRRPSCGHEVVACGDGHLEIKLRDLEQNWDAYKTSRSAAPRHRRSRSDTTTGGAPSSAIVTGAGPETPGVLVPILRASPRKLLSSLQQAGSSSGSSTASAVAGVTGGYGKSRVRRCEEDRSSVCSVDAASIAAATVAASSCSCSCECTVLCCGCGCCCSSSWSSCGSADSTSLFSLREEAVASEVRKREEERWAMASVGRFATIAVIGVAVFGAVAVAVAVLESGMDDGYVEFLVPT